jgi:hypothetical protein
MMQKASEGKKELLSQLISHKKGSKFSEKEERVWGKLPHIKSFSGNPEDYYQKVKEEDFLQQPIIIPRSQTLIDAERKIENEIKKFEHKLKSIISEEDFDNLRRHRLIGNLITIKELRSPQSLFKSRAELLKSAGEEEEKTSGYLSPDDYERRMKEIADKEFDSIGELNKAKKLAETMTQQMKDQNEDISHMSETINKIKERSDIAGKEVEEKQKSEIDITDIERAAKEILSKEYESSDAIKRDKEHLKSLISQFEQSDPKAKDKLGNIQFLFDKIEEKITKHTGELK